MSGNDHDGDIRFDIEQAIVDMLTRTGKSYLTVGRVRQHLPISLLRQLGLSRKSGNPQVLTALGAAVGDRLRIYKGPRALYMGLNLSDDAVVLDKLKQKPGVSSKALAGRLPMLKRDVVACLNRLIESGHVRCTFNHNYLVALWPAAPAAIQPSAAHPLPEQNLKALFKETYDRIGKGRGFVRIHRLRDALGWPDQTFDRLLKDLMAAYAVELHGGDPSMLSETEIRQSFVDEYGTLYITLSWWGDDHDQ